MAKINLLATVIQWSSYKWRQSCLWCHCNLMLQSSCICQVMSSPSRL